MTSTAPPSEEALAAANAQIKDLEQQAEGRVSAVKSLAPHSKAILRLYRSLADIHSQAELFGCSSDLSSSYLMHTLSVRFFLQLVTQHPNYRAKEVATDRERATKTVHRALDTLEKLKPILRESLAREHDLQVQQAAREKQEAEARRKQEEERAQAEALAAQMRNLSPPAPVAPLPPASSGSSDAAALAAVPALAAGTSLASAASELPNAGLRSQSQPAPHTAAPASAIAAADHGVGVPGDGASAFLKSFPPVAASAAAGSVGALATAAATPSAPEAQPQSSVARSQSTPAPQIHSQPPPPPPKPSKPLPPLRPIFLPSNVLAEFYDVAASNTLANIETCGILCGKFVQADGEDLPAGVDATTADDDDDAFPAAADGNPPPRPKKSFRVTHVLIPRQTATADTCNAMDEEHIYGVQDEMKLLTLGWIHTHPSQSCFLSSVDLHTHFGYQLMLSSAVAIVLAPRFQPNSGVFRCTDPGMQVLTKCTGRGFHKHEEPFPLFENAAHHHWTDAHRAQFLDLRLQPTVAGQPHALAQLEANNNAATSQHTHSHGPHHGHPH